MALMLISLNALTGKIGASLGKDVSEHTAAHNLFLEMLFRQYPGLHGSYHSVEIPLLFTSEMMAENETDSPC